MFPPLEIIEFNLPSTLSNAVDLARRYFKFQLNESIGINQRFNAINNVVFVCDVNIVNSFKLAACVNTKTVT